MCGDRPRTWPAGTSPVRTPGATPKNTEAWERLLVLHYLRTDGPFGTAPLRWIDATPIELAHATRIEGIDPEVAKASFLSTFTNEYVTRDVFRRGRVAKPVSEEIPGYFRYLILSALVPALAPEETNSNDFRVRLGALLGLGGPLSDVGGLPRLWKSLAKWCEDLRAEARPFRRVDLPERGHNHMRLIGYSIRLAFPSWRDRERLTQEVDRVGAERFDRARAVIGHLKHHIEFGTYSTSMQDAFADFYARFQSGERLLTQHRFWRLIRDVVSTLGNRSTAVSARYREQLTLSFGIDDADLSMAFVVVSGSESESGEAFRIEGTVPVVLEDLVSSAATSRWVPEWVRQTITSGVLFLKEERWGRWTLKKRSEIGRSGIIAVVRDHIAARPDLRSIGWRAAGREWVFGDVRNLGELERLLLGLDRHAPALDEDLVTLKVVGGVKTGNVLLGRPRTLPLIRATAASSLSIEAIGDTRGDPSLEPLDSDTWMVVARTPLAGTWRVTASEDAPPGLGRMEVEQNIAFDDRAVEHAMLADPDPTRYEAEVELVAARGAALEWRSVSSPASAIGMDDRLTDLLEAIYAQGQTGWAESDIVDLMRRVIGQSDGPRPWDMLRILQIAGWLAPRQQTTWRGRRWSLRPLSLVVVGEGASAVVVLDGASPLVVRERFRAVAATLGAQDVAGLPIGVWSPPVLAVQGVDSAALGEALGLSVEREFDVAPSPAPSAWPKERRSATHREQVGSWSWQAGSFRSEAEEPPNGVSLGRYRRARGDERDVYIVGAPSLAPMSFTSRASAVMEAHRAAGSPLFELDGSRLRRLAADGHLPEPVGRKLRLTHLINPGLFVDPNGRRSFCYPADRHDVAVLHVWFGAAIDAPMPRGREDVLPTIGLARHRSSTPRLAWRGGIIDPRKIRSTTGRGG